MSRPYHSLPMSARVAVFPCECVLGSRPERTEFYWRERLAPLAGTCAVCESCRTLSLKALRQVVVNGFGNVVAIWLRPLPCHEISSSSSRGADNRVQRPFDSTGSLRLFFAFAHLASTAFLASSFLCSGVSAAMRAFPPFFPPAFPPFFPISRITSETRSRLMHLS